MSATGRSEAAGTGVIRHPDDFYATPAWATRAFLRAFPHPGDSVLDPCCGDGAILDVVREMYPSTRTVGIEIDEGRAATAGEKHEVVCADALLPLPGSAGAAMILTNPPFRLAIEFITRALSDSDGPVAMLLRLNWLASQKRATWMRANTPSVYVLPRRPSFTGGKTDACEYAWLVWRDPAGESCVRILDVAGRAS